ncbi:hypothetical protein CSUI_005922 [Cystoisospora suis]|uniref:Uncharacterized protein n=1 Tax=Cystoisospora suis TaxID=483139 RepID=A0A2C6KW95_9APIC|nr:hypothetical protein CSUI_005922 [Cystoisospora suis]
MLSHSIIFSSISSWSGNFSPPALLMHELASLTPFWAPSSPFSSSSPSFPPLKHPPTSVPVLSISFQLLLTPILVVPASPKPPSAIPTMVFPTSLASGLHLPRRSRVHHRAIARALDLGVDESSSSECSEQEIELTLASGADEELSDGTVRRLGAENPLQCFPSRCFLLSPLIIPDPPSGMTDSPTMICFFKALDPIPTDGFLSFGWSLSDGAFLIGLIDNQAR